MNIILFKFVDWKIKLFTFISDHSNLVFFQFFLFIHLTSFILLSQNFDFFFFCFCSPNCHPTITSINYKLFTHEPPLNIIATNHVTRPTEIREKLHHENRGAFFIFNCVLPAPSPPAQNGGVLQVVHGGVRSHYRPNPTAQSASSLAEKPVVVVSVAVFQSGINLNMIKTRFNYI